MSTTGGRRTVELEAEARDLVQASFDLADAVEVGRTLCSLGTERGLPIALEVWVGERLAFRAALPGSSPENDDWLRRKVNTVRHFGRSSLAVRIGFEEAGTDFETDGGLPITDYAAHGGGWPVVVEGVGIVGCIAVSGLPQLDDHDLIVEALRTRT